MTILETMEPYRNFVFAGGGCRCFWQLGFWAEAAEPMGFQPDVVAGVSAGSAMATLALSGQGPAGLKRFKTRTRANSRNVYPARVFSSKPVFPHAAMYRGALEETIDEQVLRDLRQGQDLRILVAGVPRPLGPRLGALLGILSYALEKNVAGPVHPTLARTLGYHPIVMSVRQCDTPKALIDIIMASSSTPPFTPTAHCQGRPALDGGFVDNVPVEAVADRPNKTMVLLTRRYPAEKLPKVSNRTYVQPSQDVPVGKWDYTSPDGLQAAYDLGRRDGEAFAKERVARAASSL